MGDVAGGVCGPGTSSTSCRPQLHPVERLCVTLKPPPFPGWLNQSEVETYKRDCSSWQTYEDICIYGRGSLRFGFESPPMSPTTWIAPGIAFSASAILIIGTIIAYLWHRKYRSKYTVDSMRYHSYKGGQSTTSDHALKVESYSVTVISTGKMVNMLESGEHETHLDQDESVKVDVESEADITSEHDKLDITSSPESPDKDYSSFVLPNVVPYQDMFPHGDHALYQRSYDPNKDMKGLGKSVSSEPIRPTGRVLEVGYVNPAYDGNDSLKEGPSPKKKKRKPRMFFSDRKAASKQMKY
ncbi:uncharacterized protein LOC124268837 isoform X1 [Haliotis rubra]|uniref:uncharacterized protein LOC124268837 isoform X1 n=1 Tax=Haliotis rubra TaxID=36100 RepID=UPI001EE5D4C5|nr:uncharacterized protein LOC124268837 isoform X1 [Haliotis rubra]XP_046559811.1 uncharacterized protein LOC124268837 isoform X1 [Haliotis rubra]